MLQLLEEPLILYPSVMEETRDAFQDVWPGCIVEYEGHEDLLTGALERFDSFVMGKAPMLMLGRKFVFVARIWHPESSLVVHYRLDEEGEPRVSISGIEEASNREVQEILPLLDRLREGIVKKRKPGGLRKQQYLPYIERWKEGEDYEDLLKEWLFTYAVKDTKPNRERFYKALYRAGYRKTEDG